MTTYDGFIGRLREQGMEFCRECYAYTWPGHTVHVPMPFKADEPSMVISAEAAAVLATVSLSEGA